MKKSRKNHQCILGDSLPERAGFGQNLREVWRDLQDDQHWKYACFWPRSSETGAIRPFEFHSRIRSQVAVSFNEAA